MLIISLRQPAVTRRCTGSCKKMVKDPGHCAFVDKLFWDILSYNKNANNACPRSVWDRNTSAAINILALFLHRVQGKGRLQAFRRSNAVDEADVMNVEIVAVE